MPAMTVYAEVSQNSSNRARCILASQDLCLKPDLTCPDGCKKLWSQILGFKVYTRICGQITIVITSVISPLKARLYPRILSFAPPNHLPSLSKGCLFVLLCRMSPYRSSVLFILICELAGGEGLAFSPVCFKKLTVVPQ